MANELCCVINTQVICLCGAKFCRECWAHTENATFYGKGHVTLPAGETNFEKGKGYCSTLRKLIQDGDRWILPLQLIEAPNG